MPRDAAVNPDYCRGVDCPLAQACARHYPLRGLPYVTVMGDVPYDPKTRTCSEYVPAHQPKKTHAP